MIVLPLVLCLLWFLLVLIAGMALARRDNKRFARIDARAAYRDAIYASIENRKRS